MTVGGSHAGAEIMLLTITSGARFVEVPVNYLPRVGTSSVTGKRMAAIGVGLRMIGLVCASARSTRPLRVPRAPAFDARPARARAAGRVSSSHFDEIAAEYDESLPAHVVEHYLRKRAAFVLEHCPRGRRPRRGLRHRRAGRAAGRRRLRDDRGRSLRRACSTCMRARAPEVEAVQALRRPSCPSPTARFDLVLTRRGDAPHRRPGGGARDARRDGAGRPRPAGASLVWDHNPRNPYWKLLMARVPQDTGEERLVPEDGGARGLRGGRRAGAALRPARARARLRAAPRAARRPRRWSGSWSARRCGRLCAHNVVLAEKPGSASRRLPDLRPRAPCCRRSVRRSASR